MTYALSCGDYDKGEWMSVYTRSNPDVGAIVHQRGRRWSASQASFTSKRRYSRAKDEPAILH